MKLRHLVLGSVLPALAVLAMAATPPAAGPPGRMRGICWEGGGKIEPANLKPLRELGADWISQTPFGWAPTLTSTEIRYGSEAGMWGETDEGLIQTAAWARAMGIKTLLKPHLWVRHGEWQGDISMATEEAWAAWFASYEGFILHYAKLAETNKIEALAVGTELGKTTVRTAEWKRIIARVREVYHGKLTYCANWSEEAPRIRFWDTLDFVGVQAYYPLATVDRPSQQQIEAAWTSVMPTITALAKRTEKPIVFTEIGFKSHEGSLKEPWRWETQGAVDLALQKDAYAATFATFWPRQWFGGMFIWKWHAVPRANGRDDRDFTPQGKPALSVIKAYYTAR
jgi:hypothetical protein